MKIKKYSINEFPQDRIFIYLRDNFHTNLFSKIREYNFKEFNRLFFDSRLNWSTFKKWKKRKTYLKNRVKKHFIPLWFIIQLSEIFPDFPIKEMEKNIGAMKGPSASNIIEDPNLPLPEDPRLMKIIAHFLGDGHIGGAFGSKLPKGKSHSEYRNYHHGLLDSCELDLQVFGKIKLSKDYDHGHIIVPNVIGYILKHIYNIRFDCHNSRIPKRLFELPRELVAAFLRSFGDDEGHVYDSNIEYYSTNRQLLQDILDLVNINFPEFKTSKLKINTKSGRGKKRIKYSFTFYNESQEEYLDLIGFDHSQKKKDLIYNINRKKNYGRKKLDNEILAILNNQNLTAKEISRKLFLSHAYLTSVLRKLEREGKVKILYKRKWANVWHVN